MIRGTHRRIESARWLRPSGFAPHTHQPYGVEARPCDAVPLVGRYVAERDRTAQRPTELLQPDPREHLVHHRVAGPGRHGGCFVGPSVRASERPAPVAQHGVQASTWPKSWMSLATTPVHPVWCRTRRVRRRCPRGSTRRTTPGLASGGRSGRSRRRRRRGAGRPSSRRNVATATRRSPRPPRRACTCSPTPVTSTRKSSP